ncbi:MAG: V-type ATPase subunit [Actinobacteria bacterium]|nr:V-type ATPase subunit [Actinomycetota bacterium]
MVRVDLSDYGYVNARVRGMRSHLLTKDFFMRMVEADSFEALHGMMDQTVYRREINEAILMSPDRPDYDQALSINMAATLRKILDSTGGEPHKLVNLLLTRYDVLNVKTILRGKKGNATPGEIISTLLPVGNLRMDVLEQMAREREIRQVIDLMATLRINYARPLTAALGDFIKHDQNLAVLELALDRFHFEDVMKELKGKNKNVDMVRQMFTAEIDMRNISTLVRIRGIRLDDEDVMGMRLPGGSLTAGQFLDLDRLGDIVRIVGEYPDPTYRKLLEKALSEYQEIDVVAFDRELERALIKQGVAMSNVDVLGIGVIIGFMWAKQNEIINLRIVLRGKMMDQPQAAITKDLYFVEQLVGEAA